MGLDNEWVHDQKAWSTEVPNDIFSLLSHSQAGCRQIRLRAEQPRDLD